MRHFSASTPQLRRIQPSFLVLAVAILATFSGCGDDSPTTDKPNLPPETSIVTGPRSDVAVSYLVELAWLGSDSDGPVESYLWRMSDNGPDGVLDIEDTLGMPWHQTARTDSIFAASAQLDSFPADVENPLITDPIDFRNWQTHTFFVRAIDRDGAIDSTPARIDFTVTTLLPKIEFDLVDLSRDECQPVNTSLALGVSAEDEDDPDGIPVSYRYALIAVEDLDPAAFDGTGVPVPAAGDCLIRTEYEALNAGALFPESAWTRWFDYFDADDATADITLDNLPVGSSWFLAIQAKDRAEALTPTFVWNRNFLHFRVEGGFFPTLSVDDPLDNTTDFEGTQSSVVDLGTLANSTVQFTWTATAAGYAGLVAGYRFAFDAADPLNVDDAEWAVPWIGLQSLTETFAPGAHNVVIVAQDNSGQSSSGVYIFTIGDN